MLVFAALAHLVVGRSGPYGRVLFGHYKSAGEDWFAGG